MNTAAHAAVKEKPQQVAHEHSATVDEQGRFIIGLQSCDYFSLGGLLLSLASLTLALQQALAWSLVLLLAAMWFDAYDGWVARKLNQQRAFGRYLDSNIDVVMHLLVPSVWLYQWGMNSLFELLILFAIISAGIIRLAAFNDTGNIKVANKLAYLGTPVFWYPFIIAIFYLLGSMIPLAHAQLLLSLVLMVFAVAMLYRKARYKPRSLFGISLTMLLLVLFFGSLTQPSLSNMLLVGLSSLMVLALPLLFAGIFHLLVVRLNLFKALNRPLYAPAFGQNKTWRGFIIMSVFSILGVYVAQAFELYQIQAPLWLSLQPVNPIFLGLLLGMASMLGELPNSFIKRRFGIAPGQLPTHQRIWVILGDQLDSALAVAIVYGLYFSLGFIHIIGLTLGLALMFFAGRLLYAITGLKQSALR